MAHTKGIKPLLEENFNANFEDKELENFNAYFSVANKEILKMIKQNDILGESKDKMKDIIGDKKPGKIKLIK